MAVKVRQLVENRTHNSQYVIKSMVLNKEDTAVGVEANIGTPKAHTLALIESMAAALEADMGASLEAEDAYQLEKADDLPLREHRDAYREELDAILAEARSGLTLFAGREALKTYGINEDHYRLTPPKLTSYASLIVQLMRAKPIQLQLRGMQFDTAPLADAIEACAQKLDEVLAQLVQEERELDNAYVAREAAMDRWHHHYVNITALFADLLALAGKDTLAQRLRPTQRQASGSEKIEEEPAPQEDQD